MVVLSLKDTMEEAGWSFLKIIPVEAEAVVVDSWAEKLAASTFIKNLARFIR